MKTKKIILILILIFSLSFVLTGCSAIGELKTETRINDYLTSPDGPETVIEQSFEKLVSEMSNSENPDLNEYKWESDVKLFDINIENANADDGSGILTAKNIVLVYEYQIIGTDKNSNTEIINTEKKRLSYKINELIFNDNKNQLEKMTTTYQSEAPLESPIISQYNPDNSGEFSFTATIENSTVDTLGVISLGDRSLNDPSKTNRLLNITDNQLSLNTNLTLDETDFASILVINYDELLKDTSAQTGLTSMLVAVP